MSMDDRVNFLVGEKLSGLEGKIDELHEELHQLAAKINVLETKLAASKTVAPVRRTEKG